MADFRRVSGGGEAPVRHGRQSRSNLSVCEFTLCPVLFVEFNVVCSQVVLFFVSSFFNVVKAMPLIITVRNQTMEEKGEQHAFSIVIDSKK